MNNSSAFQKTTREQALSLLEYCDRTEAQLRRKLKERACPEEEIEDTLSFLKEYRYLNDAEYAARYVRTCSQKKSIRQITADLEQRGVDRELIQRAVCHNPVDEERQVQKLLEKRGYGRNGRMEAAEYRRMMGSLARKGFSYDIIHKVMERMHEEA